MANSEYDYTPMYIRRIINNRPKDVVTAKYWNELFNLLIAQGDHTAEELGNILNYFSTRLIGVESEIAESAEAIANIREVFRINVTYSHSDSVGGVYTADKTFDEIKDAYDAGQLPYVVEDALSGFYDIYTLEHFYYDESSAQGFADFKRYHLGSDAMNIVEDGYRIYSYTTDSGSNVVTRTDEFKMPPATTEKLGVVRIGENLKITDAGVLSVDAADAVEQGNMKPITSAAVYVEIGNISALLETI